MEQIANYELRYVDEYYNVSNLDEESYGDADGKRNGSDDSLNSDEDFVEVAKPKTDTSALEARNGRDVQGIPWGRLNFTRQKYRETRLKQYKNYSNLCYSREDLEKISKKVEKGHNFYQFQYNTRIVKSTIVHFQLRNLVAATSKHDVYLMQSFSVKHWSALLKTGKEVLNAAKPIVPYLSSNTCLSHRLPRVQISTMAVKDNLLVAGGFKGELVCKYLDQSRVAFSTKLSPSDDDAITNNVEISLSSSKEQRVITANNDAKVRVFDTSNFTCLNCFTYPWSVNNTSISPDGKMLAVLGDNSDCLISDSETGKTIANLKGHLDYSFSSAWNPDGRIVATGNQDTTCRLWDVRKLNEAVMVLRGRMGAIRAVKFSLDGRFMAMAEPADFVHVFDVRTGYENVQEIDLFGEISGICFSPDTEALFVGVSDRVYGSLLEFNRISYNNYLETVL
ncbi:uncharacterized WD repeat-containing protein C2A9.03 isoform X2 [Impatiens glandulifera]|uniref:uncharacterized WD repeat-containing protein C2A9.03 isoform X2 n=1 Tax=Impatiens glandulifera TaxID=253017 RepID=UPI001FB09BE4|nr:uncharacterized WD repeat-containing protein C2A9.03 isoform X2 [Impatiens glandulifera]